MFPNPERRSAFEILASSLTAQDISTPVYLRFQVSEKCEAAAKRCDEVCENLWTDPHDHIALVLSGQQIIGWVDFLDILCAGGDTIEDLNSTPLAATTILAADLSLLETVKRFRPPTPHIFIVMSDGRVTGWLNKKSLLGPPLRACLFSLVLELETGLGTLARAHSDQAALALSQGRRERATDIFAKSLLARDSERKPSPRELIDCTMFIDKVTMVAALCRASLKLPSFDKRRLTRTEALRNALAHPKEPGELAALLHADSLCDTTSWLVALVTEINETIRTTKAS